ncbi:hypothetical protein ACIBMZ_26645 [Micromonospora sp. NPDC049900]|uniref:hypothetical protein n=1 Tax=Micromonospora sp. NPDC049900 TaxID=3364275 RepID=UPI0037B72321
MDQHTATAALQAMTPRLMGAPIHDLAAAASAAWNAHRDTSLMQVAAMRAVVDAAWGPGQRAGVQRGQQITGAFLASTILRRAEPPQPGMPSIHRLVATWLHAARVEPHRLSGYLTQAGWQHTATQQNADLYTAKGSITASTPRPTVAVPHAHHADHELAMLHAATLLAGLEQRDVTQVLEDLAPSPPARAPMSLRALDLLAVAYQATKDATLAAPVLRDEGPDRGPQDTDYRTALGDWTDDTEAGRLAAAVRVGYVHGLRQGHDAGSWSLAGNVLDRVNNVIPEYIQQSLLIDGRNGYEWLRTAEVDARWAANADGLRRISHPDYQSPPDLSPLVAFPLPAPAPDQEDRSATAAAQQPGRSPATRLAFAPLTVATRPSPPIANGHRTDPPYRFPPSPGQTR